MSNEFRADLHCHSTCSDGTLTPEELVVLAREVGLSGLAITDHDTVDAYDTVLAAAKAVDFPLVVGAEFSASDEGSSVHLLGYGFRLRHPAIQELCRRHAARRENRNRKMLELLAKEGMPVDEGELAGEQSHTIGRPHIAMAMVRRGYVSTVKEAFDRYLGDKKCCYARGEAITADETIQAIHDAGGYAVIAHPHLIKNEQLILRLLKKPFDGLEGYYAKFYPRQEERWVKIAKNRQWLITGGSDFHGSVKPDIPLGSSWVGEETFKLLHQKSVENNGELF